MAPEGHGAQVLPDPDFGWPTLTKLEVPCDFCFMKFLPKCMADAPEVPWTPFMHPVPRGWGGNCVDPPITFPPQRPPLCQISSGSVQRFGFLQRIDKHTDIALYVLENGHIVLLVLLCIAIYNSTKFVMRTGSLWKGLKWNKKRSVMAKFIKQIIFMDCSVWWVGQNGLSSWPPSTEC